MAKLKVPAVIALIFLMSMLTGCVNEKGFTVGISNGYIGNNWRTQMLEDIQDGLEEYKQQGLIDKVIIQNAGLDINNQIVQIRNMINSNVDLLMIDPNSETSLNPIIEEAHKKGIPVIAFDQPVSSPYAINVVIDQQKWGENLAQWLCEKLNGKGTIIIMQGLKGHPANENRMMGIERVLKRYPDIKVLDSVNANWDQANAQRVMADLIYTHPDIDGILTQDGMALGIVRAYNTVKRPLPVMTGETMVGFLRTWKTLKNASSFTSFGQNNPPGISRTALDIAMRILQGGKLKPLPDNTFYYPVKDLVVNDNLDSYIEKNADRLDTYFLDEWLDSKELDALFEK